MDSEGAKSLRAVVGENVQRIREERDIRQADLAAALRERGVKWSWNRVSELEAGKKNISTEQLILLADALAEVSNAEVALAHLLDGDGQVQLSDVVAVDRAAVRQYLGGLDVDIRLMDNTAWSGEAQASFSLLSDNAGRALRLMGGRSTGFSDPQQSGGTAEVKLARSLNESPFTVLAAAIGLWGRSLTAERDFRAGDEGDAKSIAARRGRITRELQQQIRDRIEAERNGELPDPPSNLEKGSDGVLRRKPREVEE